MQKSPLFILTLLITISLVFGGCSYITGESPELPFSPPVSAQFIKNESPVEAYAFYSLNFGHHNFTVMDVRTPNEYASGHIPGALNRDFSSPSFSQSISDFDKDHNYLVYCRTGARSAAASKIMTELGFQHIINMIGGYSEWAAAGLPVTK
jgi:rhodanese-related sulfurtransferase